MSLDFNVTFTGLDNSNKGVGGTMLTPITFKTKSVLEFLNSEIIQII